MTCREKLAVVQPENLGEVMGGGCYGCPHHYGFLPKPEYCDSGDDNVCTKCWDREIPENKTSERGLRAEAGVIDEAMPKILDSGDRTEFESGAVRDMRVGKGRCDLMPLDVVTAWYYREYGDEEPNPRFGVFSFINEFTKTGSERFLFKALNESNLFRNSETMFLEVAKHFEEGCIKYGENNWRKGIPAKCYIDSAIRHFLKHMRGDRDEPHDRAFCWNILCCIWTIRHHPELNDYKEKEAESNG